MQKNVRLFTSRCHECNWAKNERRYGKYVPVKAECKLEHVSCDFYGSLPQGIFGKSSILIFKDTATRFIKLYATKFQSKARAIYAAEKFVKTWGTPEAIYSDNTASLTSKAWYTFWEKKGFRILKLPAIILVPTNQKPQWNKSVICYGFIQTIASKTGCVIYPILRIAAIH